MMHRTPPSSRETASSLSPGRNATVSSTDKTTTSSSPAKNQSLPNVQGSNGTQL